MVVALAGGVIALIIAGGVLLALALIAFAVWAHQFTKVGPNEVLIISGRRGRKGPGFRIVRGGGTYVRPFREKVQRLSLELMQFDVRSAETYTMHGVPVQVDGVCMVKIDSSDEGISRASEQFLSRGREDIVRTAMQAVEGHMRASIGALSIEDIYRERQRLVAAVRTMAGPDLERMGLEILSLTIRNVADKQGYLEALGRPRTAQVKRDAIRGEAEADREAKAARFEADLAIEDSRRAYETGKARHKAEGLRAAAEADLSYELQQAITRQQVRAEELKVEIVERQKAIELMTAEVERRRRELEAEIIEPALARAREITAVADAHREEAAAMGAGEADALRLKGLAEAEAMAAKARSWGDYNEAAITDRVLEVLPALAAAVSAPLAQTEKIVMIGGNGSTAGASKITKDVTQIMAEMPEVLEALTGLKLEDLAKRIPGVKDSTVDGEAEELR
ncbi:MAG: flotillin [Thermoleophilaceae bacterium]|jgi:flotillin|nr:flotillin [Thermoleophilaceae bacterium]MEA2369262.1 flotillin [Thermoleophilaceae bacterium]